MEGEDGNKLDGPVRLGVEVMGPQGRGKEWRGRYEMERLGVLRYGWAGKERNGQGGEACTGGAGIGLAGMDCRG